MGAKPDCDTASSESMLFQIHRCQLTNLPIIMAEFAAHTFTKAKGRALTCHFLYRDKSIGSTAIFIVPDIAQICF